MGRGTAGIKPSPGTGPKSTTAPKSVGGPGSESTKGRANASQKTTTAPGSSFSFTTVNDSKPRTAREKQVDQWNRDNPSVAGGEQFLTYYGREKREIATTFGSGSKSGSASVLPGKPKQAQ